MWCKECKDIKQILKQTLVLFSNSHSGWIHNLYTKRLPHQQLNQHMIILFRIGGHDLRFAESRHFAAEDPLRISQARPSRTPMQQPRFGIEYPRNTHLHKLANFHTINDKVELVSSIQWSKVQNPSRFVWMNFFGGNAGFFCGQITYC